MTAPALSRYAWLSVLAALATIGLKAEAYFLTGSVGLLSDAIESLVNLAAALFTLLMLVFSDRPADADHPFGHGKAEYFASGFEGSLILIAAGAITWAAWGRFRQPAEVGELDIGMAVSAGAALLNLFVAGILLRAGRRHHSIALEADARHLLSDVWTTVAVLAALGGILLTGWQPLDPIIACLAAAQIAWSGVTLMYSSAAGLMDIAIPTSELAKIQSILDRYRAEGVSFHELKTRMSGRQRFMTVHVLVPGVKSVKEGHDLAECIERELQHALPNLSVLTHLEPLEDETSFCHEILSSHDGATAPDQFTGADRPPLSWAGWASMSFLVGAGLIVLGSIGSMLVPEAWVDAALGISFVGLLLCLEGWRRLERGD